MPSSCDRGGNQSRPRCSRPNAAAAAGAAAAAAANARTPALTPPAKPKNETPAPAAAIPERGGLRRPGPRARGRALLRSTPHSPSSCDRGGIKADPVARDPTRPQQPAPPQRSGSCQRPNASPHPTSETTKETQKAGASRSDPRARRSAPPRPSRARACAIKVNAECHPVASWVDSNPTPLLATQRGRSSRRRSSGSCQRPNASPHPTSETTKRNANRTPAPAAAIPERGGLRRPGPRAREDAPLRLTPHSAVPVASRDGIEADPVARDPTRPQQPAPQQRQLPTPERQPSPHQRKHKKKRK